MQKKKLDFLTKIHMQHVFYFSFFLLIFYVDVPISFITKAFVEYSSASKEIHTSDTCLFFFTRIMYISQTIGISQTYL